MKINKTLLLTIASSFIIGLNLGGTIIYFKYKSSYAELTERYTNLLIEHQSLERDYNRTKGDIVDLVKNGR